MARKRAFKGPKTLFDKVKDIDPSFVEEIYLLKDDDLNKKLLDITKYELDLEAAKKKDTDLQQKRAAAKVAGETYSVPLGASKLKKQLILQTLKERGKA